MKLNSSSIKITLALYGGTCAAAAYRDYVILLLLAGTGQRVGELAGPNLGDVDLADQSRCVCGKGGRYRHVWWSVPPLQEEFAAYLERLPA